MRGLSWNAKTWRRRGEKKEWSATLRLGVSALKTGRCSRFVDSVGEDGVDDGGHTGRYGYPDDIVWRLRQAGPR